MSAPASITYKTVTGRYVDASGSPMSGAITFTPLATRIVDTTDGALIALKPVRAVLDGDGEFEVSLMIGNDGDVSPSGWSYDVREDLVSGSSKLVDNYSVAITSAMSSPILLTDLVPGQAATITGGLVRPALIAAHYTAQTTISNTTTETDLTTLTIPEGGTVAGSILVYEAGGVVLNSSGGSINHTWKAKLGATTLMTSTAMAVANNANDFEWYLRLVITWTTATTQRASIMLATSAPGTANWGAAGEVTAGFGTASESMSGATDVTVTVTPGTASSSYSMQARWGCLTRYA